MSSLEPADIEERLRRGLAAFSEGDFDAAVALAADDIELVRPGGLGSVHGADAFRQWMEPDALEGMTVEILDVRIAGDKGLVEQRTTARGAGSGIELDVHSWGVWTIGPDGLATKIELFLDNQEAEAVQAWGG